MVPGFQVGKDGGNLNRRRALEEALGRRASKGAVLGGGGARAREQNVTGPGLAVCPDEWQLMAGQQ